MSRNIWIISDTHLSHENILKFTDSRTGNLIRGHLFDNIGQMDEYDGYEEVMCQYDIVWSVAE